MTVPNILVNGSGNYPDADKLMDDLDYVDAIARGTFISNPGFELWTAATSFSNPADNASICDNWKWRKSGTTSAIATISRETTNKETGAYAVKIDVTTGGSSDSICEVQQQNTNYILFAGQALLLGARVKTSVANKARLKITDGVTTAYSAYHSGGGAWESLYVLLVVSSSPTQLYCSIELEPADFTGQIYADSAFLFIVRSSISNTAKAALAMVPPDPGDVSGLLTDVSALKARTISTTGLLTGGGDLTANRTFDVPAAAQADQETGSSTTKAVTPGVQHHHPSAAKAWVYFTTVTTTSNLASYGISSLTDNGTGDTTINFSTSFSSANYAAVASIKAATGIAGLSRVSSKTSSAFRLLTFDTSSGAIDVGHVDVAFYGDF